jgi:hypothetical protein
MASFIGSNQEFRRYIGPRLRNLVQQITKKLKAEVAACEHCGTNKNLESAHVAGRDRNEIIDLILKEFTTNDIVTVDLSVFEEKFKEEHHPIERIILILCRDCHREYDSEHTNTTVVLQVPSSTNTPDLPPQQQNIRDSRLPITLDPSDPFLFKQELLISKKAEIETTYSDGKVERKPWNASRFTDSSNVYGNLRSRPEYRSGNWQSLGITRVHVRVIDNN